MATILIVDDDGDTRELTGRYLRVIGGHRTLLAADGREALDLLADGPVDLIVLDLLLPRMGGTAFLSALGDDLRHVPVLVCSALGREFVSADPVLDRAAAVLYKDDGFFIDLIEAVTRHLRGRAGVPTSAGTVAAGRTPAWAW
jgi:two-component system OmpR family response regulator